MTNGEERRQNTRAEIKWPIEIELSGGKAEGMVENISSEGACISCVPMPDPGESVRIILKPSDYLYIRLTAEVIWAASNPQDKGGIVFTEISEKDRDYISGNISDAKSSNKNETEISL